MDTERTPILSVQNLRTYFFLDEGTVRAVDGINFDICPGQVLGIVGESGCGKSVTIKSVLRIVEEPGRVVEGDILYRSGGQDRYNGKGDDGDFVNLAVLDAHGKQMRSIRGGEIALIPQEPMSAFSPVHTIGDQISEAILLHQDVDKRQARRIAIERLHEVGVPAPEERINSYSWELSGGLRQRAMIAMALSCSPRLLIADEPTTAIDVTTQAQILRLLRTLQEQHNMAIIFITHDLGVIAQIAEWVAVMYLGRMMEMGPVDDIFHSPQHPYTRALLKSIPSVRTRSRVLLPTIEGSIPHPFNRPPGCPFHPRCPEFMPWICDQKIPVRQSVNKRQSVSCFLYHRMAEED